MPKGKGDAKRHEKQEKRHVRNRSVRSAVKTFVGKARTAILSEPLEGNTEQAILKAIQELDRASRKGIIHPNNAARRKSRLIKRARTAADAA
ncbi:MAG: 30S ribosomal protein S20 [Chloroflexota bacterium]